MGFFQDFFHKELGRLKGMDQHRSVPDLDHGADRHLLLHGRSADLINIVGKRTSLTYLNHQLNAVAGVEDGAFFMPDDETPDGITRLAAAVVAPGLTPR